MSTMTKRRLRMKQWLTLLLDRETTPGIRWEDKSNAIFRINWKHGSRHGYSAERDALVFRKWAEYTGKVDGKSAPDPKRWKANFRCALNSLKDVIQLSGRHSRGVHAFRLYQFTPHHGPRRTRPLQPIAAEAENRCSSTTAPFRCSRDVGKMDATSTDDDDSSHNNNNLPPFIKIEPSYESYDRYYASSCSRRSLSEGSDVSASTDDTPPSPHFFQPNSFSSSTSAFTSNATILFQENNTPLPPFQRWTEALPGTDFDILNNYQTELVNFNDFNEFDEVR